MTNKKYEEKRNSFLKHAEKVANDKHGAQHKAGKRDSWLKQWIG